MTARLWRLIYRSPARRVLQRLGVLLVLLVALTACVHAPGTPTPTTTTGRIGDPICQLPGQPARTVHGAGDVC